MCTSECRTFLWGGSGQSKRNAGGECSCTCQDETWSNRNILGRASCVPGAAHTVFGLVGLVISVGVLSHAAHHLRRQLKFHEHHMTLSFSPVERCRHQLHILTIIAAGVSIFYYLLVIGDALRWCTAVAALSAAPSYVGSAVLAARMWMYTNDARLLRESPRAVVVSDWLESPFGNTVACCGAAAAPFIASVLALADFTRAAARLLMLGGLVLAAYTLVTFVVFGKALLKAINKSLHTHNQQRLRTERTDSVVRGTKGGAGTRALLEARRKVQTVLVVIVTLVLSSFACNVPIMISGLDLDIPLVIIGVSIFYIPLMWLAFSIKVHSGRSASHGRLSPKSSGLHFSGTPFPRLQNATSLFSLKQEQRVVPTDTPS